MNKPKHGFSGSCAPSEHSASISFINSFSLGIFEFIPKKNGGFKHGKVKVRVYGPGEKKEMVYERAREIMNQLDAGTYIGPKNVKIK